MKISYDQPSESIDAIPATVAVSGLAHPEGEGHGFFIEFRDPYGNGTPFTMLISLKAAVGLRDAIDFCIAKYPDLFYGDDHGT